MNGHGGIDDENVELAFNERGCERILNRGRDNGPCLALCRDDDFRVPPTVEKEVLLNFAAVDVEVQADR
jgi:hypothetical protein